MDDVNLKEIEELAAQKEQEWQSAVTVQIKTLQEALKSSIKKQNETNKKFVKLKDDFKYNLKLLQERDKELQDLDNVHHKLKVSESRFLAEISDLHIKVDNAKERHQQEKKARDEIEMHYKQQLLDQQTKLEAFRTSKNHEIEETVSELRRVKLQYEQRVSQLECELESQKIELLHEFEGLMKVREKEFSEKEEETQNKCRILEMKNKILNKEMEFMQDKEKESNGAAQVAQETTEELRKKLQQTEWDIADVSSLKNARILELEGQVKSLQEKCHRIEEEFHHRRAQLDKDIRVKQANVMAAKQANLDREKNFEDQIRKLNGQVETAKLETNRALWDSNDIKKQFEIELQKRDSEICSMKARLEEAVIDKSKSVVAKDTEMLTLSKRADVLRNENKKLKEDVKKYKTDLAKSIEREELSERSKTQLKLDWKRKCEDLESIAFTKSEDLTTNLMKRKNEAEAKTRKSEFQHEEARTALISASRERDLAVEILNRHKLIPEWNRLLQNGDSVMHYGAVDVSQNMQDLRDQNEQLKAVIKRMTNDMQQLRGNQDSENTSSFETTGRAEKVEDRDAYVESLEKELLELKKENRRTKERLLEVENTDRSDKTARASSEEKPVRDELSAHHPTIQKHINELNKTIGSLEAEKIDLRAQLQKLHAQLDHQMAASQQHQQESKTLSTKVQQLEYEATAMKHRTDQEAKQSKDRISALTLNLAEARQEADEYYRGGIKNNMRAMELSGKISQMTVDIASNTPWVSNHVQAKLMQDLQSEVTSLRKQLAHSRQHNVMFGNAKGAEGDSVVPLLQHKLKLAAMRIRNLLQEKTMLLEAGNKMRSELMKRQAGEDEKEPEPQNEKDNLKAREEEDGRLDKMEKLQYHLTKQELAFAQRHPRPNTETSSAEYASDEVDMVETDMAPVMSSTVASRLPGQPMMFSMSSLDDASMKDVWKVLEQAPPSSPSVTGDADFLKANIPERPERMTAKSFKVKPRSLQSPKSKPKPRVRNYNVKDDAAFKGQRRTRT